MSKQEDLKKYLCIHGHFYQPPRENAWLEEIEIQDSASPYHDWNERIAYECYGPNAYSRILNDHGNIVDIVNNYARISFNFGPTLLSWLQQKSPRIYQAILDADKLSLELFEGRGSAMAQVYNHIIMPLASKRDKITQVKWGIYDFEQRFQRKPEGMWLAETAVDTETLEVLVDHDIKFTVLAPDQAAQWRVEGEEQWHEHIDSRYPYRCKLPGGKEITLFFYDGQKSQEIAFNGMLNDGAKFAHNLLQGFDGESNEPQLVHVATDGETYGHHHKNGDMALAYCLRYLESNNLAQLCNYAWYMQAFPATREVQIAEESSWSCAHGVGRWKLDCGCKTGGEEHWNQQWRAPLREGLNWLRDQFDHYFEEELSHYFADPWQVRNEYIQVIFDREANPVDKFVKSRSRQKLAERKLTHIIRLLDMQKQSQLMFTSCGWFFNDISGIETVQILQYACRGIQLLESETDVRVEQEFLDYMDRAHSNIAEKGSGRDIYLNYVKPQELSLTQVGMHYAANSLFKDDPQVMTVLNYNCESKVFHRHTAGNQVVIMGRTFVRSRVTLSEKFFSFAILYLGNHHLVGNTSDSLSEEEFEQIHDQIQKALDQGNLTRILELIRIHFRGHSFSFFDLFKDQQHKMLEEVLENNIEQAANSYQKISDSNQSLLNVMRDQGLPIPELLRKNLEIITEYRFACLFDENGDMVDLDELEQLLERCRSWHIELDSEKLSFEISKKINRMIYHYENEDNPRDFIENIATWLPMVNEVKIFPQVIELQNYLYGLSKEEPEWLDDPAFKRLAEEVNLDLKAKVVV